MEGKSEAFRPRYENKIKLFSVSEINLLNYKTNFNVGNISPLCVLVTVM